MSLINKARVKKYTLDCAKQLRAHPFTRVSKQFMEGVEAHLMNHIRSKVQSLPSKGKTINYD